MKSLITSIIYLCISIHLWGQNNFTNNELSIIKSANNNILRVFKTTNINDSISLRQLSIPIIPNTEETIQLIKLLKATVQDPANDGVGIAAPQVGINRSLFIIQRFDKLNTPLEAILNPSITWRSNLIQNGREGCLSIPDTMGMVDRHYSIEVKYQDFNGEWQVEILEGFTAIIFQHEFDHLMGILFLDRLKEQHSKTYFTNQQQFKYLKEQNTR